MLGVQGLKEFFPEKAVIHCHVDASAVFWGLLKGTANPRLGPPLQSVVLQLARRFHPMVPHLVPSKGNRADKMSRRPDPQDYSLDPLIYRRVCTQMQWWPNLDLFANRLNHKCPRYFSWRPDPGALGVDALVQTWNGKGVRPLFNPPWAIIPAALQKLREEGVLVLAILPVWTTRFWWPWVEDMVVGAPIYLRGRSLFQGNFGEVVAPPTVVHHGDSASVPRSGIKRKKQPPPKRAGKRVKVDHQGTQPVAEAMQVLLEAPCALMPGDILPKGGIGSQQNLNCLWNG